MTEPSLIALFVRPLNELGLPYLVTGGVASIVYGEPRFTRDIDIVLRITPADAGRVQAAWRSDDFYLPPVDVIGEESGRGGHFNIIHRDTALRADIYVEGDDELHAWAMARPHLEVVDGDG